MYKLCVYVPEKHVETVKTALFNAGAGRIGNYDQCCWQNNGIGNSGRWKIAILPSAPEERSRLSMRSK